jgi:hypothetical protein
MNNQKRNTIKFLSTLSLFLILVGMIGSIGNVPKSEISTQSSIYLIEDQNMPLASSDRSIVINLKDLNNQVISDAFVILNNTLIQENVWYSQSDVYGNVTFSGLENSVGYRITVKYGLGSPVYNFTIQDFMYNLNIESGQTQFLPLICNLTSLNLSLRENGIYDPNYWGLNNANVTFYNESTEEFLTSVFTDVKGEISLRIPEGPYLISITYQGNLRSFLFHEIVGDMPGTLKNLTLFEATEYYLNVSVNEPRTELIPLSVVYNHPAWSHADQLNTVPFKVDIYYQEQFTFKFQWREYSSNNPIENITSLWNTWSVQKDSLSVNNSVSYPYAILPVENEPGNYMMVIDSNNYGAGQYLISIHCNKVGFQNASLTLTLSIINNTANITLVSPGEPIEIIHNTYLNLCINYTSRLPFVSNLSSAVVNYTIIGQLFSGTMSLFEPNSGLYNLSRLINLNVGSYTLEVTARQDNYEVVSIQIILIVTHIPTKMALAISNSSNKVSENYMKVAFGENISFSINYTSLIDGSGINAININVSINNVLQNAIYLTSIEPGLWMYTRQSLDFPIGMSNIIVEVTEANYEYQTKPLILEIISNWTTKIEIIEPPLEYYWGDNASFIVKWMVSESEIPRNGSVLTGGMINQLKVFTKVNGIEYVQKIFSSDTYLSTWGFKELVNENYGSGFYRIWFLTSQLNLSVQTVYYIAPKLSLPTYLTPNTSFNFKVNPRPMNIKLFEASRPSTSISSKILSLNDDATLWINLTLSPINRATDGNPLNSVVINYNLKNKSNSLTLDSGIFQFEGNGLYSIPINTTLVGAFVLEIKPIYSNHTYSETNFYYNVTSDVIFDYIFPNSNRIDDSILRVSQEENITFWLNILDNEPHLVTFKVYIGSGMTPVEALYINDSTTFLFTIPANNYPKSTLIITVVGSKSEFAVTNRSFTLQIIEKWQTRTELASLPQSLPWGNNISCIIKYTGNELPRIGHLILNGNIGSILLQNEMESFTLGETERNSLWGYVNLKDNQSYGDGFYLIWFNSSLFTILQNEVAITLSVYISGESWATSILNVPILIYGVGTALKYASVQGGDSFSILKVKYLDNDTISVYYNVSDTHSGLNGSAIANATVKFVLNFPNGSFFTEFEFNHTIPGWYNLTLQTHLLLPGEFQGFIIANLSNYTSQIRSFTLFLGIGNTSFSLLFNQNQQLDNFNVKLAKSELFSFMIIIPDANGISEMINVTLNSVMVGQIQYLTGQGYRFTANLSAFDPNTYDIKIIVYKENYLPSELTIKVQLISAWKTQVNLIEPPLTYPWGNKVVFNVSYHCIENPRQSLILSNGKITELKIVQIIGDQQISIMNLTENELNTIWGWNLLTPINNRARYSIWFDTHYLSINTTSSYYLIPTIITESYSTPIVLPYCWIKLVSNSLQVIETIPGDSITLYLNQTFALNLSLTVTDSSSIYFNTLPATLTIRIQIFDKTTNQLVNDTTSSKIDINLFRIILTPPYIGNFTILITMSFSNFQRSEIALNLIVPKKTISPKFVSPITDLIINAPVNLGYKMIFSPIDPITDEPIVGAKITAQFQGLDYILVEDPQQPGKYILDINPNLLASLDQEQYYPVQLQIEKDDYEVMMMEMQIYVGVPVDPYLKLPYRYWAIIGSTVGVALAITVTYKAIQYKNIPATVKKINKLTKMVRKKQLLPDEWKPTSNRDVLYGRFNSNWVDLELDMKVLWEEGEQ